MLAVTWKSKSIRVCCACYARNERMSVYEMQRRASQKKSTLGHMCVVRQQRKKRKKETSILFIFASNLLNVLWFDYNCCVFIQISFVINALLMPWLLIDGWDYICFCQLVFVSFAIFILYTVLRLFSTSRLCTALICIWNRRRKKQQRVITTNMNSISVLIASNSTFSFSKKKTNTKWMNKLWFWLYWDSEIHQTN